MVGLVRD